MTIDISIGYGDNEPAPAWVMPFAVAGSSFELTLLTRGVPTVFTSAAGDLTADPTTDVVTWNITSTESSAVPVGTYVTYKLRRLVPDGEQRIYASGRFFTTNDTVDATTSAQLVIRGPQGAGGQTGPSAYDLYVSQGGLLSLQEWLLSLSAGSASTPTYTADVTLSGHIAVMFQPDDCVVPANPNSPTYVFAGITLGAAQAGAGVKVQIAGQIIEPSWTWIPQKPVFVLPNSTLSQTAPTQGVLHAIGSAINATTLLVAPQTPVILL